MHFYPRSPCGERQEESTVEEVQTDISIHALLAESDGTLRTVRVRKTISIHALLAESDGRGASHVVPHWYISIHALLAESDFT